MHEQPIGVPQAQRCVLAGGPAAAEQIELENMEGRGNDPHHSSPWGRRAPAAGLASAPRCWSRVHLSQPGPRLTDPLPGTTPSSLQGQHISPALSPRERGELADGQWAASWHQRGKVLAPQRLPEPGELLRSALKTDSHSK